MTDPMNTDALRAITSNEGLWESEAALVASAADEVDRLRAELAISVNRAGGYEEVVARLRAVIENAPHRSSCGCHVGADGLLTGEPCTCWKADAL